MAQETCGHASGGVRDPRGPHGSTVVLVEHRAAAQLPRMASSRRAGGCVCLGFARSSDATPSKTRFGRFLEWSGLIL